MQFCQTWVRIKLWARSRSQSLFLRSRDQPARPAGATRVAWPSCTQSAGAREAARTAQSRWGWGDPSPRVTGQSLVCSRAARKTLGAESPRGQRGPNCPGSLNPPAPSWICWRAREASGGSPSMDMRSSGWRQGVGGMQKLERSA